MRLLTHLKVQQVSDSHSQSVSAFRSPVHRGGCFCLFLRLCSVDGVQSDSVAELCVGATSRMSVKRWKEAQKWRTPCIPQK